MAIFKNKKFLIGLVCVFAVLASISFYNIKTTGNIESSKAQKIIGSDNFTGFRIPFDSLEKLVDGADAIIIGTVVSEGVTKEIPMNGPPKVQNKIRNNFYNVAECNILVDKVLYGDESLKGKDIYFWQLGKAGDDNLQTKVKKDHKMLFVLKKAEQDNTYASIDFEDGLFDIDSNNKVVSLSNNKATAKYDNSDLADLEKDIINAKSKKQK